MPRVRLTDRFVAGVKPTAAQTDYFDDVTPGLFLRVSAKRKAWGLLFTRPGDGKRARTTFGTYPEKSLSDARARAIILKDGVSEGVDAREAVQETKAGPASEQTVEHLTTAFITDRRRRDRRTVDDMERVMKADVVPVIGTVALSHLHRRDLVKVTDAVLSRGAKTQANRVAALLKAMTAWGLDNGYLETDPGHRWKPPAEAKAPRERALTPGEIATLWRALENADASRWTIEALRLCLITGARQGEVAGMMRSELDLDERLWRIPAERSKNKREHIVPLSDMALSVIEPVLKAHKLPAVFPGPRGTPLTNSGVARAVQRSQKAIGLAKWTAHDLRRTAATQMAELGVSPFDIGLVLNHVTTTKATITTSVYARYDYAKEKRAALEIWAERLSAIIAGRSAEVLPLNKSKKRYGISRGKKAAAA